MANRTERPYMTVRFYTSGIVARVSEIRVGRRALIIGGIILALVIASAVFNLTPGEIIMLTQMLLQLSQ